MTNTQAALTGGYSPRKSMIAFSEFPYIDSEGSEFFGLLPKCVK